MGNAVLLCAFPQAPASQTVVKLVHGNSLVEEFYRPVMVGELTPDYPYHFICHSQGLLSFFHTHSPPLALPALPDDSLMQLGQIYFLLPIHSPLSQPCIASLFSEATFATKTSYKDLHVPPLSHDPRCNGHALFDQDLISGTGPISSDFFRRLLNETRLQLPATISGPFLIDNSLQKQSLFSSSSAQGNIGRPSELQKVSSSLLPKACTSREPWRPPLETIMEEGNILIT